MSSQHSINRTSKSHGVMLRCLFSGLLILCLTTAAPLWARETVVLQKGGFTPPPHDNQFAAFNNYVEQANPTTGHGGQDVVIQSFATGSANSRGLVRFDLSSVGPAGVKDAQLELFLKTIVGASSRTYNATRVTSTWLPNLSTWNNRIDTVGGGWTTPGGDATGGPAQAGTGTTDGVTMDWGSVIALVRPWFDGTAANNGFRIADNDENNATQKTGTLAGHNDAITANRPRLTLTVIQQVTNLSATPGNGTITLNWAYPSAIGTVTSPTTGVVIVRSPGAPVADTVNLTDGTLPGLCTTFSGATVVFLDASSATSFVDDGSHGCGGGGAPPANGTTYYYRIITRDAGNFFSTTGTSGDMTMVMVPEVSATPSATVASRYASNWIGRVGTAGLTPPGLNPNDRVIIGSNSPYVVVANAGNGNQIFSPLTVQGATGNGRPPIIEAADSKSGIGATYISSSDGFLYNFNPLNGQLFWVANPTDFTNPAAENNFQGGAAVLVKSFGAAGYTLPEELVIVCTNNTTSATANEIVARNAESGGLVWKTTVSMDVCSSTPLVDYTHGGIIVTTRDNAGTQSNLRRIDPNTGTITHSVHLGAGTVNLDTSPSLSALSDLLVVGASTGAVYAVRPDTLEVLSTFTPGGSGAITGSPLVGGIGPTWPIIFTRGTGGTASVRSVNFTCSTFSGTICTAGAFSAESWGTTVSGASAVITSFGLVGGDKVYVSTTTGLIEQLNITTGAVEGTSRSVGGGSIVGGAPSVDTILNRVYAGASNGRVFSYSIPF